MVANIAMHLMFFVPATVLAVLLRTSQKLIAELVPFVETVLLTMEKYVTRKTLIVPIIVGHVLFTISPMRMVIAPVVVMASWMPESSAIVPVDRDVPLIARLVLQA